MGDMSQSHIEHLRQTPIEGVGTIIEDLIPWLETGQFNYSRDGRIGKFYERNQRAILGPLLDVLGVTEEVRVPRQSKAQANYHQIDNCNLCFAICRIPGPILSVNMYVRHDTWAYIVPLRIIDGTPTVTGLELRVGEKTEAIGAVIMTPAIDFLIVVSQPDEMKPPFARRLAREAAQEPKSSESEMTSFSSSRPWEI